MGLDQGDVSSGKFPEHGEGSVVSAWSRAVNKGGVGTISTNVERGVSLWIALESGSQFYSQENLVSYLASTPSWLYDLGKVV